MLMVSMSTAYLAAKRSDEGRPTGFSLHGRCCATTQLVVRQARLMRIYIVTYNYTLTDFATRKRCGSAQNV